MLITEFMKYQKTLTATLSTLSVLIGVHCKAQIILDQSQTEWGASPRTGDGPTWGVLAQTFTPKVPGELASVSLWLTRANATETNALLISIADIQDGVPGAQLGHASLTRVHGDFYEWYSVDFLNQSVHLCRDHQYALVLSCPGSFNGLMVGGSVSDTYSLGEAMERFGDGPWQPIQFVPDLEFETYMQVAIDKTPPTISVSTSRRVLWPPTGAMVPVRVSGHITDDECDGSGVDPNSVRYAVTDDDGKVETTGAIPIQSDGTYGFVILLQASRPGGNAEEREYTITVTSRDRAGNTGSASTSVTAPRDTRRPGLHRLYDP